MIRRTALILALATLTAAPALAQTPFPCRIGPQAKDSHLLAERFDLVVRPELSRTEYRLTVRNPHAGPAAVLTGIDLPGIVESPAEPVIVPARGTAQVTIGWFPLDMSRGRMAPPMLEEVRAAMTVPLCEIQLPERGRPLAQAPIQPSGLQIVRDEGAHQGRQRL